MGICEKARKLRVSTFAVFRPKMDRPSIA